MRLNVEIVEAMQAGFGERRSVASLAAEVGEDPRDVLPQLQRLLEHGFALRWSDGRWSLSKHGERLKSVLTDPTPTTEGRPPSLG